MRARLELQELFRKVVNVLLTLLDLRLALGYDILVFEQRPHLDGLVPDPLVLLNLGLQLVNLMLITILEIKKESNK